ncbi:MAG: hypothetical protein HYV13_01170 [Candidatus Doudnabacteria bacterium]|nr:hypothetical protein [Candidatus Doudnabacteria bacterium]
MEDWVNKFAKELADAIAAVVAEDPTVEAVRAKARESGYEMRLTLEAVVGFASRKQGRVPMITNPNRQLPAGKRYEFTANDCRGLRAMGIDPTRVKDDNEQGK